MVGARVRRQQVAYAQARGLSRRRACALLSVARSTLGYESTLLARDAGVVPPMRTLAAQYPRYGYRTIRIFLERQGHALGVDRMHRLWRQEAPAGAEETATSTRGRPVVHGPCRRRRSITCGRTTSCSTPAPTVAALKCLTVIDEFTRECLAIDVAGGIRRGASSRC